MPAADTTDWREVDDHTLGIIEGIAMYAYTSSEAWAATGVHYVGTTGKSLREAKAEVLRERGYTALAEAVLRR